MKRTLRQVALVPQDMGGTHENSGRAGSLIVLCIMAVGFCLGMRVTTGEEETAEEYMHFSTWDSASGDTFNHPNGVAVDSSGNVYVADTSNHRIRKFDSNGKADTTWAVSVAGMGGQGTDDGKFNGPAGVVVDAGRNLYVAENGNNRIQKFKSDGTFIAKWGRPNTIAKPGRDGEFYGPQQVAVDPSGNNVYVADTLNHRIQKFDSNGTFIAKWGSLGTADGEFNTPYGVVVDGSRNVYVADTYNNRIQKFKSDGTFITKWPVGGEPKQVAVDGRGNVYACAMHGVQKFKSDGAFITKWGSIGAAAGYFENPYGIAVDSNGNYVYVADTYNNRIQKFVNTNAPEVNTTAVASEPAAIIIEETKADPVKLTSIAKYNNNLKQALEKERNIFLPPGTYMLNEPIKLSGGKYIIAGSGRAGTTMLLGGPAFLVSGGDVSIYNLSIRTESGETPSILIEGEKSTLKAVNLMFEYGNGVVIKAPGEFTFQGCYTIGRHGSGNGLTIDHPEADVTWIAGNHGNNNYHILQQSGYFRMYGTGLQQARSGVDIEIQKASSKPFIIAACRSEGPKYFLEVPESAKGVSIILKANGYPVIESEGYISFNASKGRLYLIGNNLRTGRIEASGDGEIYSVGTFLGEEGSFSVAKTVRLYSVGDMVQKLKHGQPFLMPANVFVPPSEGGIIISQPVAEIPAFYALAQIKVANMSELIPSVVQYGAKGDGRTDDCEAIQKALNEGRGNGQGKALYFPEGTYRTSKPLRVDYWKGGWLVGAGSDRTTIINSEGGTVFEANCIGFATVQDLTFETSERGESPAVDLSWDNSPGGLGAGLQGNNFYRCRFIGGSYGVSMGTGGFMGDTHLFVDCLFSKAKVGAAVRCCNALCNNFVNCKFEDNDYNLIQTPVAGSFNAFSCSFLNTKVVDLHLISSAYDTFLFNDIHTDSPLLHTGHNGASVNVLIEGLRVKPLTFVKARRSPLIHYSVGSNVILVDSQLNGGIVKIGGNISEQGIIFINTEIPDKNLTLEGRGRQFSIEYKK